MATMSDVVMSFPGGRKVVAEVGGHRIITDQPVEVGGEDAGPSPFTLFIASIGACAGFYALSFFQKRGLATDELRVMARPRTEEGALVAVDIAVSLPDDFPEKYRDALLRSIDQCSVKRAIHAQPTIRVELTTPVAAGLVTT